MNHPDQEVLLVTGGGRGIGAAIVRKAVARGRHVFFSYLNDDAAAGALVAELGPRAAAWRGDVADPAFAEAFHGAAEARFGPPTGLVNNAGTTGRIGAFADLDERVLRRTFEVNVTGALLLTQAVIRRWLADGRGGNIVNISSIASTLGSPGEYVHYAASKAAIDAFTIGVGKELAASGIRVNAVAAGTTDTEIHAAGGAPDRAAQVAPRVPMRRVAQPEEIAEAALWLLSAEASYVTGAVLRVSGGL